MAPGRKTGGRIAGVSKNKPKPIKLQDTEENRALVILSGTTKVRSPRAVMMDAMLRLDGMAKRHFETKDYVPALKYLQAAVMVADRLAPYCHARLLSIESRSEDKAAPFVVRAPAVMSDSSEWQAAVGAAVIDMEAAQAPVVRQNEVSATQVSQTPQSSPAPLPVTLTADPKTSRITVMPPGPRVVQPSGTQEWLDSIQKKVG